MAPAAWDDEDSESTPPSSPPVVAARRSKFDDEEDDADVLDSWDAAEDSEVEREKEKKAAEAKAKAEAEAKANHKSKSQRIEEKRREAMRKKMEEDMEASDDEETEAEKRARLREEEKASDLANAEDMFGNIGISDKRGAPKAVTVQETDDPASAVDLSSMKLFKPANPAEWRKLNETLTGLLTQNAKKPQYAIFMQDFAKQLVKDLNSEQVRKIATGLSTMSNEKMKEEKAAEKGGKKSKAAKTKPSVVATKDISSRADTMAYDDGLEE
jgi:translation initiation factor 3 subunit J